MSLLIPKTAGYVNLSYCVATVQADLDDFSDRKVEKMTQYAIRAYTDMNIFNSTNVEVVYLTMDANGIVDISTLTDFVDYVKIGIPVNGKIWVLNKNEKILLDRNELDDSQADLIFNASAEDIEVGGGYYFAGHYLNGSYLNGVFGLGGGFSRSYFRIDKETMQIQFDTAVPRSQIILEYISTGVNATGGTIIPRYAVEYIVAYIHWQLKLHNTLLNRFEKKDAKQEFIERENILTDFQLRFRKEDYFMSTYSTFKQSPKQ